MRRGFGFARLGEAVNAGYAARQADFIEPVILVTLHRDFSDFSSLFPFFLLDRKNSVF